MRSAAGGLGGESGAEGREPDPAARPRQSLAGESTPNRLELSAAAVKEKERYKKISLEMKEVDWLLVKIFLEAHTEPPAGIVLDLDATDDPLHGHQEGRFFHGYYGHYCYMPLYIFAGDHLLCARLRPSNIDASAGCVEEMARIVAQIRRPWPEVRITLRVIRWELETELQTYLPATAPVPDLAAFGLSEQGLKLRIPCAEETA